MEAHLATVRIDQDHVNLCKLFSAQANTLPKYKGSRGEQWRSFETTFKIKWANSALSQFPLDWQKRALLGCLEGQAARAHTLLAEGSEGWNSGTTIELFLVSVRNLFNPPEESALARLEFEGINQGPQEAITVYYSKKVAAFYGAVTKL